MDDEKPDDFDIHDAIDMVQALWGDEPFATAILNGDRGTALPLALQKARGTPERIEILVDYLLHQTQGIPAAGPPETDPIKIERNISWRPGDETVVRTFRAGYPQFALMYFLLLKGDSERRDEIEIFFRDWMGRYRNVAVDLVEITKDQVKPWHDLDEMPTAERYVVRYRDIVWTATCDGHAGLGQRGREAGRGEPGFYHSTEGNILLRQVDQIWRVTPREG